MRNSIDILFCPKNRNVTLKPIIKHRFIREQKTRAGNKMSVFCAMAREEGKFVNDVINNDCN